MPRDEPAESAGRVGEAPATRTRRRLIVGRGRRGASWCGAGSPPSRWCRPAGTRRHGLDQLESAQHELGPAQLIRGEGLDRMRSDRREFDAAASAGDSFLLKPFMVVPVRRSPGAFGRFAHQLGGQGRPGRRRRDGVLDHPAPGADDRGPGPRRARPTSSARIAAKARGRAARAWTSVRAEALVGPLSDARTQVRPPARQGPPVDDRGRRRVGGHRPDGRGAVASTWCSPRTTPRCGPAPGCCSAPGVMTMQNGQFDLGPMTDTGPSMVPAGAVPVTGRPQRPLGLDRPEPGVAQPRDVAALPAQRRARGADVEGQDRRDGRRGHRDRPDRAAGADRGLRARSWSTAS